MNVIRALKLSYFAQVKTPLGRWNIHNQQETTLKIKYANEDNCGISGNNQQKYDFDDNQYIYSMGYESVHN